MTITRANADQLWKDIPEVMSSDKIYHIVQCAEVSKTANYNTTQYHNSYMTSTIVTVNIIHMHACILQLCRLQPFKEGGGKSIHVARDHFTNILFLSMDVYNYSIDAGYMGNLKDELKKFIKEVKTHQTSLSFRYEAR